MIPVVSIEQIKNNLKTNDFLLNCKIPMGYSQGLPVLMIKNDCLCVTFPYLKYKITGKVDKTLVFPLRYGITLEIPTEKIVCFEDYEYREEFRNIDFDKPIGFFRHEALKGYDKKQYNECRMKLMNEYDKAINAILGNTGYTPSDEKQMRELLQLLTEPSLLPMYKAIDSDFYNKYLARG
ncbi:MAG: hypothetical protein J1F64_02685 [Oscillospiraceae bacterium]|nr:hypothetical protein [Oscillospiraceae bacterium]